MKHQEPRIEKLDQVDQATADSLANISEYYRNLNFKDLLAACPLEGIDLARTREFPRDIKF